MSKLAIFGGKPIRTELFSAYNTIGDEEIAAVTGVLKSGVLSRYLGCWHPDFYGGPQVQAFEKLWAEKNDAKYAISVNSNTSGLITCLGAAGIQPGDEVIVSPYSMSASAISPVFWGGIPVFADIDEHSFCLSAETIEPKITENTKAILVVHIFGHPADMDPIMELAKKHNLIVIEDCAQAPFGKYKGRFVGTLGHMGIFSLNYHKHIHTGEGGVITTNDDKLAEKCQLIRNHAEAVADDKGVEDYTNLFGMNLRLPEIEAAIGIEQLKKIDDLLASRIQNAKFLNDKLKKFDYLDTCVPAHGNMTCSNCSCENKDCLHCYYVQPIKYFAKKNQGLSREKYLKALSAELPSSYMREEDPLISGGYVKPLYLQQIYQRKKINFHGRSADSYNYNKGICPVAERMYEEELILHEFMRPSMSQSDLEQVVEAFEKVDKYMSEIIEGQNRY